MKTLRYKTISWIARSFFSLLFLGLTSNGAAGQTNTFPSSGNVGVGTTTPTYKLQINGSGETSGNSVLVTDSNTLTTAIDLANTSSGAKTWRLQSVGSSVSGRVGNFELVEIASNLKAFVVQPGGSVGIGMIPVYTLDVNGGVNAFRIKAASTASNDTIATFENSSAIQMILRANGNLGIGTVNPGEKLVTIGNTLSGNITSHTQLYSTYDSQANTIMEVGYGTATSNITPIASFVLSKNLTSANNALGVISFANSSIANGLDKRISGIGSWTDGATNSGTLQFYTASVGTFYERLRINSGGNVGIGTTNPFGRLHLAGNNTVSGGYPLLKLENTQSGGHSWWLYSGANGVAGDFGVYDETASSYRLNINATGNVGIGTSTPGYKLDVNGEINATGLRINGSPIPTGGSQWSDGSNAIYYTSGNVGIGANAPALQSGTANKIVEIKGSVNPGVALTSTAAGGRQFFVYSSQANPGYFSVFDATAAADRFVIDSSGRVGIGTAAPASSFQIGTQTSGASASPVTLSLGGSFSNSAGSNLKLKLYDDGNSGNTYGIGVSSGSMDFGVSSSAGYHWYAGGTNKMTLANNGDLSVSGTIAAKYQDVAEWVQSSEQLAAGTVVVLDADKSNHVISSSHAYDTTVAGVISAQPGIALGERAADKVLVATTGRVRVRVDATLAPIRIGDLLVTSDIVGVAMKSDAVNLGGVKFHRPGTIIGKALEPLAKGSGEILVLLSLQ